MFVHSITLSAQYVGGRPRLYECHRLCPAYVSFRRLTMAVRCSLVPRGSQPCSARPCWSFVPIVRDAEQILHAFHIERHTHIARRSTIYLHILYLVRKPMLLLHALRSLAIAPVAVGITAIHVPSSDKVAPKF